MNEELSFFKKTSNYAALILFKGFLTSPHLSIEETET